MTANAAGLTGGLTGSPPEITITKTQTASKNMFFEPIPNDMLFTDAEKPQVKVTVGDDESGTVTSVCK